MLLSRLQCRRFFTLFDALTAYANSRLGVVDADELFPGGTKGKNDRAQAKVAYELWQNLNIIDDFVNENPFGFTAGELDTVASWREGLTGMFIIDIFPDGVLRFLSSGFAFDVKGFSKEIESMVGQLPSAVQTTLLPFDGAIVYAEYLGVSSVELGDGMLNLFDEEIDRLYNEGRIISDSQELLRIARDIRAKELEQDIEDMMADLESGRFADAHDHAHESYYDEQDDDDLEDEVYGQHRGALVGLTFEEREQAIEEHMGQADDELAERLMDLLDDECLRGELTRSLLELLSLEDRHDMRRFARYLGLVSTEVTQDREALDYIAEHVADEGAVQAIVDELSEHHIQALRNLAERGGRWDVEESDIRALKNLPIHEVGLSYVFHENGVFSFVMPDEIVALAPSIDWDGAIQKAIAYREIVQLVDKVAELRGIAPITDVVQEYFRCYPNGYQTQNEVVPLILRAVAEETGNFGLLQTESREMYVLYFELMWAYEEQMGIERNSYFIDPVTRGELGEMLENLLMSQEGIEPRPLDVDMLEALNLLEWKMRQPAAWAFCQYLDAHVPDVRDDYYFADKVMEELLDGAQWGLPNETVQYLFDTLERNDFVPEANQMQDILDLWSDLSNGLPIWPNNGWSPNELAQMERALPAEFYNEDGSLKIIGRNDPCPCGSGLKYKKCHGQGFFE